MPFSARLSRSTLILVLCCLAQFMIVLDIAIVNLALPSMRTALHFEGSELQWVVNAYTLTFAGFLLLGGRAADLIGRRRMFAIGMLVFGLASLVGGLATDRWVLVGARGLQGIGGAIVAPATLSILSTTFTEGAERNRALGAWGAMGGVGGAAGGLIGGGIIELLDWRWILFINVPISVGAIVAALRLLPGREATVAIGGRPRHFDLAGTLTVTLGLLALVLGIVRSEEHGWGSAQTLAPGALGLALLATFVLIEQRIARAPLVPLRIFSSRTLTGANVVVFALGASVFAMWYFTSLYMQEVLGLSPIEAGVAFLPMTGLIITCSMLASRLVGRVGPGPMLAAGLGTVTVGMLLFSRVSAHGSWAGDVLVPGALCALGIGFAFVPVTIAAVSGVRAAESGLASGLINTSRQVGGSLGLAILATIATSRTAGLRGDVSNLDALTAGYQRAFEVGAGFAAAGAIAALLLVPRRRRRDDAAPAATPAELVEA